MPGGEKKCEDCGETYQGGTDLSKYGCRCLKAKYTAAKANKEALGNKQPQALASDKPGAKAVCDDCWGEYNKGTNLRLYGCPCVKAKLEAVFAEPEAQKASEGCCPPDSIPPRPAGAHKPKGVYKKLGDLEVYEVGESKNGMGVLVVQEIFGIHGGNLAEICDILAEQGFAVLMADFHRGVRCQLNDFSAMGEMMKVAPWSRILEDFTNTLLPEFKQRGATRIGALGLCYGSWVMLRLAGTGLIKAGVASHPSHPQIGPAAGDDVKELVQAVRCPVQIFTAGGDDKSAKPGGQDESIIKPKFPSSEFREFKDMKHGWVSRGDWEHNEAELRQGRDDALKSHIAFLTSHL